MVEKINLPIKISGDTLSAIEFNQVVDKTNNLITEFNSATTLASDYWQAVASPGDIYIPEDVRTSVISGMMMINGPVYKYDNETEALIELNVPGASTSNGGYAVNDLVLLNVGAELGYAIYGVNDDLSLTDLTTWFTQEELDNIEPTQLCYVNGAIYGTTDTYDASGNYIITKRTATETTILPLTIEMTGASGMTRIQLQKLDSTHIALWNSIVEPPLYNYVLDGILTVGDSVTVTVHTATDVFFQSISWMHDFPSIAGVKSDGSLIFPADAESGTVIALRDVSTAVLGLDSGIALAPAAMLDSETRRILMFLVGEQYGFFDADSMTPIMPPPQFSVPVNPMPVGQYVGNILHQKSDGTYIYIRQESTQVFESTDLITWTLITPNRAN